MPPDAPGVHSTGPPRPCGGNIDCKELVVGSTLFLPISVDGVTTGTAASERSASASDLNPRTRTLDG